MTDGIDHVLPLAVTHLSLPRYARIMGINPVHFAGGVGTTVWPAGRCNDLWWRYSWQANDRVSLEELADTIHNCELEIAEILGYPVAPQWVEQEVKDYPRYHRREMYNLDMLNVRGQYKSVKLKYGKFLQGGTRAANCLGTVQVAYSDESLNGFTDTATITLPGITETTDITALKVYFLDSDGNQEWEIRPCRNKTLVGGVFTATFDPWLFIDPDVFSYVHMPPTGDEPIPLNLQDDYAEYYVTEVDICYEYNDYTQPGAILFWEQQPGHTCLACGGAGCPACFFTTQDGCIHARDSELGLVAVVPSSYDATNGYWLADEMVVGRDPDELKLYYYAGMMSDEFLSGRSYDPLSNYLAQAIAWMATARLERDICSCGNLLALFRSLREDLSVYRGGEGGSRFTPEEILTNPFGPRRGEVQAWQRIDHLSHAITMGAAVG